jgi:hypothetical protein
MNNGAFADVHVVASQKGFTHIADEHFKMELLKRLHTFLLLIFGLGI